MKLTVICWIYKMQYDFDTEIFDNKEGFGVSQGYDSFIKFEKNFGRKPTVLISFSGKVRNGWRAAFFYKEAIDKIKQLNLFNVVVSGYTDYGGWDGQNQYQQDTAQQELDVINQIRNTIDFNYFQADQEPPISDMDNWKNASDEIRCQRFGQQYIKFDRSVKMVDQKIDVVFRTRFDLVFNPIHFVEYFVENVHLTVKTMCYQNEHECDPTGVLLVDGFTMWNPKLVPNSGITPFKFQDWNFFMSYTTFKNYSANLHKAIDFGLGPYCETFEQQFGYKCDHGGFRAHAAWLYGLHLCGDRYSMISSTLLPIKLSSQHSSLKKLLRTEDYDMYRHPRWENDTSYFTYYYLQGWELGESLYDISEYFT